MALPIRAVDQAEARAALADVVERTTALLVSTPDGNFAIPGSSWTVGDAGAHMVIALRAYADAARGDVDALWGRHVPEGGGSFGERVAAVNASTMAEEAERDPIVLARMVGEAAESFLDATAGRPADEAVPTPWYGSGRAVPLLAATCLLVGEQLVHGYDVAEATGREWVIEDHHAHLVLAHGVTTMLPFMIDREAAGDLRAAFQIHVRGGPGYVVRVEEGTPTVELPSSSAVDCHIWGRPVALLLVGYGRVSQWRAITRGELLAWGRRPWLALRFTRLFSDP